MNAETVLALVQELSPLVTNARVAGVRVHCRDCALLELATTPPRFLGIVTARALPLMFETDAPGPAADPSAVAPREVADLRGAVIVSLEAEEASALVRFRRVNQAGRPVERILVADLGSRPSLSVRDVAGGVPAAPGRSASSGPGPAATVGWRRDDLGRLHVAVSAGDGAAGGERRSFSSVNEAAVWAYREFLPVLDVERRRRAVDRALAREIERKRRAAAKVEDEIRGSADADVQRHHAQLLLLRSADVPRGRSRLSLLDYDGVTPVDIDVDPRLTPGANAEALFRRARRAERRAKRAPARLEEIVRETARLESLRAGAASATGSALSALEAEVHPPRASRQRAAREERAHYRTYTVTGGWRVLVGRSNRDNDILTHRIARPDDLWFHARQVPGSHVVLRRERGRGDPPMEAILEAAAIAAFHSKSGRSRGVPVCYTERRYVRKPRGAKPGLAIVKREKVVFVDPRLPER